MINVDGAIFSKETRYAVGCVARDHDGKLIAASNLLFHGVVQPEVVEIMGIKEALS